MDKKTVFITGGSRGIGRAAVKLFAREGCRVCYCYKNSEDASRSLLDELCAEGLSAYAFRCDVSSGEDVANTARGVLESAGQVDTVVNNAGISLWGLFQDVSESQWDEIFAVNVRGIYSVTRAFLPQMIRRGSGSIVNVSSVFGITGASCEAAYSATKAAVIGLTKSLARELGPSGIRVNCVAPGVINTDMNSRLSAEDIKALADETPLMRTGSPEEAARAILYLAGDGASFVTGQVLAADGGFSI